MSFEAYRISVRVGVIDATRGGILNLATQFGKAQKEASSFLNTLRAVNEELRRSTGGWANNAASGFNRASRAANDYSNAAGRASRASGGGMAIVGSSMAFAGGALSGRGFGGGRMGGGAYPALSGPAGSSGGRMRAAGWFSGGAGGGAGGGGGFGYGPFGKFVGGMMLEQAGKVELGMLKGPIDEAMKYQQAVTKFSLYGLGDKLNSDAVKFAKGMNIFGTSMTDAMEDVTEAQGVFRESGLSGSRALAGAKLAAPMLAKIAAATSGLDGDSQAKMHTQGLDMLRFIEQRGGLSSAAKFNMIANDGWKAIRSSGGNVNWSQYRQFMSTGGVSAQGLTDQALFGEMEPVIGELKGGGAGHALMTAFSRLNGLQRLMPRIMTREMMRLGLWDKSKLVMNSQGGVKDFIGNPLKNADLFSSDPVKFYEQVVLPAYAKGGITSANDTNRENAILFGNTGGKMFSLIGRQLPMIHHSVEAQKKTLGLDAAVAKVKGTTAGQLLEYHKQLKSFQTNLGLVIIPIITDGLKILNPLLKSAGEWIGEHSTLTKGLIIVFASLGALAMVSGSIIAIAGAFTIMSGIAGAGTLLSGLTGMAGAFGALTTAVGFFMAAYAGWQAGSYIGGAIYNNAMANNASGKGLGKWEADLLYRLGMGGAGDVYKNLNDDANPNSAAYKAGHYDHNRFIAANPGKVIQVHSTVVMDGRKVAQSTTHHQAKSASRAQSGMSRFDSSQLPAPIGLGHY